MDLDALVFDFDGLILDTEWTDYVSVSEAFTDHGVELPLAEWRAGVGAIDPRHWSAWLEDLVGRPIDRETVRAKRLARHHALVAEERVRPGVVKLLDEAAAAGIPVGVASSSGRSWVVPHLDRLGLLPRFGAVFSRDDVERPKPAPDLYLAATAALGARPSRSIAFEDSAHGATAARAAGLRCVVAPNRMTADQDFTPADLVVSSLAEVRLADLVALVDATADARLS